MKIVYGLGNFLSSGAQIVAYPATQGINNQTNLEKSIFKKEPEVWHSVQNMYSENPNYTVVPPALGDVIWVYTSGNKWYAHCIVYETDGTLNFDALELCMKSVAKKCNEIEHHHVSMPYFDVSKDHRYWPKIYPMIEDVLSDAQVYVFEPDQDRLLAAMDQLPGNIRKIFHTPRIRFRKSGVGSTTASSEI